MELERSLPCSQESAQNKENQLKEFFLPNRNMKKWTNWEYYDIHVYMLIHYLLPAVLGQGQNPSFRRYEKYSFIN